MTTAHSKFGASSAKRWLSCPGSVELCKSAPPQRESEYAAEGTRAHECLEVFLKNGSHLQTDQITAMVRGKYPDDMIEHVKGAYFEIKGMQLISSPTAEYLCETKVDLSFINPEMFGTVDAAIVDEYARLTVIDFKYGAGIVVDPKDNAQLSYYALGLAHKYDYNFKEVSLVIIQPRAEYAGQTTRQVVISVDELISWTKVFKDGVEACKDPLAELSAGDHCRFCPATPICPEVGSKALRKAQVEFAPEEDKKIFLPDPESIQIPYLGITLEACDQIEAWIEGVRAHAFHVLERGEIIKGFKLVQKRATRKWANPTETEQEAERLFGKSVFKTSLLTPAQFEKVGTKYTPEYLKAWVEEHTTAESSGLTLVSESDKRAEVKPLEKVFTEVEILPEKELPKKLPPAKNISSKTKKR